MLNKKSQARLIPIFFVAFLLVVILVRADGDFSDKGFGDGISLSKSKGNGVVEHKIISKNLPMEKNGKHYTLSDGTRVKWNHGQDEYSLDTIDGLECTFNWDSPTALDVRDDRIDFKQGEIANLSCNWETNFLGGYTYLIGGKYYLDIDPSFYISNDTAENAWSNGTFYRTTSDGENVTLNTTLDSYTKLLLHMDGADGGTIFIDSSGQGHIVGANGNANTSINEVKFGNASAGFDGVASYLNVSDSDDWDFGTDDFTIDFWVNFNNLSKFNYLLTNWDATGFNGWGYRYSNDGEIYFYGSDGGTPNVITSGASLSEGVWTHVALVRSGTNLNIYINGLSKGSSSSADSVQASSSELKIGISYNGAASPLDGYIDELRITKGIARWTGNFTVPDFPYGYYLYGNYTSQVFDAGVNVNWTNLAWTNTSFSGTDLVLQTRTSNDNITYTAWSSNHTNPSGFINESARYLQYRAEFYTTNPDLTAYLEEVNITYETLDNAPVITDGNFSPVDALTANDLNCSARGYDVENASSVFNLTIYKDGILHNSTWTDINNTRLEIIVNSSFTAKSEVWICNATINDGVQTTANSSIGEITIGNTPPQWDVEPANQTAQAGNETNYTLQCSDPDGDPVTYYNNITGTETSYYSLFNSSSGLFQFRPSYYEYTLGIIPINVTCANGEVDISTQINLNVTASTGGGAVGECDLGCVGISPSCHAVVSPTCTLILPS